MFGTYLPVLSVGEGVAVVMVNVDVAPIAVDDNVIEISGPSTNLNTTRVHVLAIITLKYILVGETLTTVVPGQTLLIYSKRKTSAYKMYHDWR